MFLGHSVTQHKKVSDQTQDIIDEEVRRIIDRNYQRSSTLLKENEELLHAMAEALIRYETINVDQIKDVMEGREPRPPQDSSDQPPPGGEPEVVEDEGDGKQSPSGSIGGPRESSLTRTHGSYPTPSDALRRHPSPPTADEFANRGATHPVARRTGPSGLMTTFRQAVRRCRALQGERATVP